MDCPDCGTSFKSVGKHIGQSDCEYPDLSEYQRDLLTGMLMGDGSLMLDGKHPRMAINMINKRFLEWFDDQMEMFTTGVRLNKTAKEKYQEAKENYPNKNIREENYHDYYRLYTRKFEELQYLAEWYSTDRKVFPNDIELTPTVAKLWYCGDGTVNIRHGNVAISAPNERKRSGQLISMFNNIGFDPYFTSGKDITFLVSESQDFLDYIGQSPPGFEYKWELNNRDRYEKLKDLSHRNSISRK